jgi:hypothetical protein
MKWYPVSDASHADHPDKTLTRRLARLGGMVVARSGMRWVDFQSAVFFFFFPKKRRRISTSGGSPHFALVVLNGHHSGYGAARPQHERKAKTQLMFLPAIRRLVIKPQTRRTIITITKPHSLPRTILLERPPAHSTAGRRDKRVLQQWELRHHPLQATALDLEVSAAPWTKTSNL